MTQSEKAEMLKSTIEQLYAKEGRSKSYISRLLDIERTALSHKIEEWGFEKANCSHLSPSNEKFLNKNKDFLIKGYNEKKTDVELAKQLGISVDKLRKLAVKHPEISAARNRYLASIGEAKAKRKAEIMVEDLPGEQWKEILGYPEYCVSNKGRVKSFVKRYNCYRQLAPYLNPKNGRFYVKIKDKNLQVSRLVGFAFVEGYSEIDNTIDHIDGDVQNNEASNLQWVPQRKNNQLSYDRRQRRPSVAYGRHGKFKEIVIDNRYHFKTIRAAAKFLGISETQCHRYLDKECKSDHIFQIIY